MILENNRLIECSRDWTAITVMGNNGKPILLDYSQIKEIRFGYHTQRRLFTKKTSEKIEIRAHGLKSPILLLKPMDREHFDQYKQEITKFAKDNKIRLIEFD
ncbi:MAG TPA: hypothetical protein PK033_10185 [Acetivibrio sp.]|nr:hypothetical protein [Acetivibrio sp.]HPT90298.1 hypothetical protein [Acetivibrio sp.]HQA58229.1 hypothetical protein [Acetivibrio sp.]